MGHYNAGSNNLGSRNSGSGNMGDMNAGGWLGKQGWMVCGGGALLHAAVHPKPAVLRCAVHVLLRFETLRITYHACQAPFTPPPSATLPLQPPAAWAATTAPMAPLGLRAAARWWRPRCSDSSSSGSRSSQLSVAQRTTFHALCSSASFPSFSTSVPGPVPAQSQCLSPKDFSLPGPVPAQSQCLSRSCFPFGPPCLFVA